MPKAKLVNVEESFAPLLLAWFDAHGRDLPWRRTRNPYHIWVAETMLQQTQVPKVVPYYQRFLEAYPTVSDLAVARVGGVLRLWEGLGYYARAQQLHQAADLVVREHGGHVPRTRRQLLSLPGVGPYTAGAILSIAFGEAVPALDTNALRVLSRVFWLYPPHGAGEQRRQAEAAATAVLSSTRPGDHNQALMDLATLVCTRTNPDCPRCPLQTLCEACRRGKPEVTPDVRRQSPQVLTSVAAVVRHRGRILLARRPLEGLWRGLWELPNCECPPGHSPGALLTGLLQTVFDLQGVCGEPLHTLRHGITNRRIILTFYDFQTKQHAVCSRQHLEVRWVALGDLDRYALPAPHRRALCTILTISPVP